ncbi:hypothetical protein [Nocardiopsis potens]|uniref:hypothetical protein n=1 Tax=Nocardiopsis potens TaxID=1246458 RepID=UPI001268658D|nr:hypothetical protein [Nocardiopsis potens]
MFFAALIGILIASTTFQSAQAEENSESDGEIVLSATERGEQRTPSSLEELPRDERQAPPTKESINTLEAISRDSEAAHSKAAEPTPYLLEHEKCKTEITPDNGHAYDHHNFCSNDVIELESCVAKTTIAP